MYVYLWQCQLELFIILFRVIVICDLTRKNAHSHFLMCSQILKVTWRRLADNLALTVLRYSSHAVSKWVLRLFINDYPANIGLGLSVRRSHAHIHRMSGKANRELSCIVVTPARNRDFKQKEEKSSCPIPASLCFWAFATLLPFRFLHAYPSCRG